MGSHGVEGQRHEGPGRRGCGDSPETRGVGCLQARGQREEAARKGSGNAKRPSGGQGEVWVCGGAGSAPGRSGPRLTS